MAFETKQYLIDLVRQLNLRHMDEPTRAQLADWKKKGVATSNQAAWDPDAELPNVNDKDKYGDFAPNELEGVLRWLSETAAANLFPNGENPIGQSLWSGHDSIKVAGIIKDVRTTYGKLSPMIVRFPFMKNEYDKADGYDIILKIKPEVDLIDFEKKFRTDFLPTLKSGAFSVGQFESMDSLYEIGSKVRGVDSQKKLRYILSMFFICCAFFGITGTFWIKCNKQRSQIGLLRAMGSPKAGIIKKFFINTPYYFSKRPRQ